MDNVDLPKTLHQRKPRVMLGLVGAFAVVVLCQTLWETPSGVLNRLSDKVDLAGTWESCLLGEGAVSAATGQLIFEGRSIQDQCLWAQERVPGTLSQNHLSSEHGWVVFRKRFETPKFCGEASPCSFIVSELGDAALIVVNGSGIATHGGLPPREKYARHYPLQASIPSALLKTGAPNDLWVVLRYMKKSQAGILRGPVAIVPSADAFSISRRTLIQNVLLPLMSAVGVGLMAALGLLAITFGGIRNARAKAYVRYCVASALFLTSYTSLPREGLPLAFAGCLHFLLRFLMDACFFEMAMSLTHWKMELRWWVRSLYGVALSVFILQFALEPVAPPLLRQWVGFNGAVEWSKHIDSILLFGAYAYGAMGAVIDRKQVGGAIALTFSLTALLALIGCLTFHGAVNLPYFVMLYPFFVALIVGAEIAAQTIMERERIKRDAVVGLVTRQIVHNLKSPLTSLWHYLELSSELPSVRLKSMKEVCQRMGDMVNGIIPQAETLLAQMAQEPPHVHQKGEGPTIEHLGSLIDVVVSSKRIGAGSSPEIFFDLSQGYSVFATLRPVEFKQMLTNFLDNAIEATQGRANGWVEVELRLDGQHATISVRDNGCGISQENLKRIGKEEFTSGKLGGHGLGVQYSLGVIRSLGGRFEIRSKLDEGTQIEIFIPLASPPRWFADKISVNPNGRVVVLDDDPGIRELWRERLAEIGVETVILKTAQEARIWLSSHVRPEDTLLFDHELLGEKVTGTDLLAKVNADNPRYLVTSYFGVPELMDRCRANGVRVLSKAYIPVIEFELCGSRPGLRYAEATPAWAEAETEASEK